MIIVSDTTPISELAKAEYLDLLPKIFGKVVIPQTSPYSLPENTFSYSKAFSIWLVFM